MKNRALSGSGLFLIELLIGLLIFAIASAICLRIFVASHQISAGSVELNHAVVAAQNSAECFRATNGDLPETAELLGGDLSDDNMALTLYFDADWNKVALAGNGYFAEIKRISKENGLIDGEVAISRMSGDLIFSIPVSVMEVAL